MFSPTTSIDNIIKIKNRRSVEIYFFVSFFRYNGVRAKKFSVSCNNIDATKIACYRSNVSVS